MNALFLSDREIIPAGDPEFTMGTDGYLQGAEGRTAKTGLTTDVECLRTLQPVVDRSELIVVYLGKEGLQTVVQLASIGIEWVNPRVLFITVDHHLEVLEKCLCAYFAGSDCILAEAERWDGGMADHVRNFLQYGMSPGCHMRLLLEALRRGVDRGPDSKNMQRYLERRLDPFGLWKKQ